MVSVPFPFTFKLPLPFTVKIPPPDIDLLVLYHYKKNESHKSMILPSSFV